MNRIAQAFALAYEAHQGDLRKSTSVPYIVHPMDVAATIIRNHGSEDLIIAAFLHDVVEDTETSLDALEEKFGPEVSRLVKGATEPQKLNKDTTPAKKSWKDRKTHTIEFIKSAPRDMKLLSCADKLANLTDMMRDFEEQGEQLWQRFNASKEEQAWYYNSMLESFGYGENSIADLPAYQQFKSRVETFFGPV